MEKIYIVFKNADFVEGRGPMQFHMAFSDGEEAIKYVKVKPGIFGLQKVERNKYGLFACANGYEINEVYLYDTVSSYEEIQNQEKIRNALNKLTEEEKKLLGLEQGKGSSHERYDRNSIGFMSSSKEGR